MNDSGTPSERSLIRLNSRSLRSPKVTFVLKYSYITVLGRFKMVVSCPPELRPSPGCVSDGGGEGLVKETD